MPLTPHPRRCVCRAKPTGHPCSAHSLTPTSQFPRPQHRIRPAPMSLIHREPLSPACAASRTNNQRQACACGPLYVRMHATRSMQPLQGTPVQVTLALWRHSSTRGVLRLNARRCMHGSLRQSGCSNRGHLTLPCICQLDNSGRAQLTTLGTSAQPPLTGVREQPQCSCSAANEC